MNDNRVFHLVTMFVLGKLSTRARLREVLAALTSLTFFLRSFHCFALRILTAHNLWRHERALVHAHIENMEDLP